MVPDKNVLIDIYSSYDSLIMLFEKMCELSEQKKQSIIENDWGLLQSVVLSQNEIKQCLDDIEKRLSSLPLQKYTKDSGIEGKKSIIRDVIAKYKEIELLNVRLLKDSLYTAKLKATKIFNMPLSDDTYSPVKGSKGVFGCGVPLMYDRLI